MSSQEYAKLVLFETQLNIDCEAPHEIILNKDTIVIGRLSNGTSIDYHISCRKLGKEIISRRHAIFKRLKSSDNDKIIYTIQDVGAINGLYVNNHKITNDHILRNNDIIQFGGTVDDTNKTLTNSIQPNIKFKYICNISNGPGTSSSSLKRKKGFDSLDSASVHSIKSSASLSLFSEKNGSKGSSSSKKSSNNNSNKSSNSKSYSICGYNRENISSSSSSSKNSNKDKPNESHHNQQEQENNSSNKKKAKHSSLTELAHTIKIPTLTSLTSHNQSTNMKRASEELKLLSTPSFLQLNLNESANNFIQPSDSDHNNTNEQQSEAYIDKIKTLEFLVSCQEQEYLKLQQELYNEKTLFLKEIEGLKSKLISFENERMNNIGMYKDLDLKYNILKNDHDLLKEENNVIHTNSSSGNNDNNSNSSSNNNSKSIIITPTSTGITMDHNSGGCLIDTSSLQAALCCPSCSLTLVNSVVLPCSHGYCRSCLESEWSKYEHSRGVCLVCHDIKKLKLKKRVASSHTHQSQPQQKSLENENLGYFRSDHLDNVLWLLIEGSSNDIRKVTTYI